MGNALSVGACADDALAVIFRTHFVARDNERTVFNHLSPDSFVQMSIMLAYYQLYGKMVCTYEPVLTKSFYHGRTEAMRSATLEAKRFCEIWADPKSTSTMKNDSLRQAASEHSRRVRDCAAGMGVDRHLFALKCIATREGIPTPAFFGSEAWKTLNHTILSTSNCGNPSLRLFGFGPVVPNGFGIGYIIKDHGIQYSVSSKHRQTARFVLTLQNTLRQMGKILKCISAVEVGPMVLRKSLEAFRETRAEGRIEIGAHVDMWGENEATEHHLQQETGSTSTILMPSRRPILQRPESGSRVFASVRTHMFDEALDFTKPV
jgi:Choline/Carnitine o-acyltransferase